MKPSVNDWAEWAEGEKIDGRLINFLLRHPEIIEGSQIDEKDAKVVKGNLRTWTKFFNMISGFSDFSASWNIIFTMAQNSLPLEHLIILQQFIEAKLDKIISVEQMLNNDIKWVKNELTEIIGKGSNRRTDLSAVISKRLLNYCLANYKTYTKDMVNNYGELLESDLLKPDLVLLSLKKTCILLPKLVERSNLQDKLVGI